MDSLVLIESVVFYQMLSIIVRKFEITFLVIMGSANNTQKAHYAAQQRCPTA
jgi:hypothetical protein